MTDLTPSPPLKDGKIAQAVGRLTDYQAKSPGVHPGRELGGIYPGLPARDRRAAFLADLRTLLSSYEALQVENERLKEDACHNAQVVASAEASIQGEAAAIGRAEALQAQLSERDAEVEGLKAQSFANYNDATQLGARLDSMMEALRDALGAAYEQGCIDTHNSIQAEPELALMPVESAEFGEAASDYAIAALASLNQPGDGE